MRTYIINEVVAIEFIKSSENISDIMTKIDNAFLNGDLDHDIFMKMPEGYKECIQDYEDGKALKLDKAIYGLVQAARQF